MKSETQVDAQGITREVLFKSIASSFDVRGVWAVHTDNFIQWMNEGGAEALQGHGVPLDKLHELNGGGIDEVFKFIGDFSVTPIAVNHPSGESFLFLLKPLAN